MRKMLAGLVVLLWGMELASSAVAAENNVSPTPSTAYMTLGNCEDVQTPDNPNGQLGGGLSPAAQYHHYLANKANTAISVKDAKVTVLADPQHGVIKDRNFITELGPYFKYTPDRGYLGEDKVTFLVKVDGKSIKVVTTLYVVPIADSKGVHCFGGPKLIND